MAYSFNNPYLAGDYEDLPRLQCMSDSNERYRYFKCTLPEAETYTLIAKIGKLATREIIEMLGYTIVGEGDDLPAYRLYKIV